MALAINVQNISKAYRLGEIGTGTLVSDLQRWFAKINGKEDPFALIGEINDRTTKGVSDIVWSLKDVNFQVEQGQAMGIIGRNGAGKSTLLKILSRVTSPTTGTIKLKGRVASLLEVGTGFHPELTGRENVFLNGAILGMRKKEIVRKFSEIVDFAGVERYIDTPVKRYSSGMYVRLAFAVAAYLESEILIIDEVLAVGDSEFQRKCLGKMNEVNKGEGRTVLFVSHNMGSISQLCDHGILLHQGLTKIIGSVDKVINTYMSMHRQSSRYVHDKSKVENKDIYFKEIVCLNSDLEETDSYKFTDSITLKITIVCKLKSIENIKVGMALLDRNETRVFTSLANITDFELKGEEIIIGIKMPEGLFAPGPYKFLFAILIPNQYMYDMIDSACDIKILDNGTEFAEIEGYHVGNIILKPEWYTL